jgi:hypothetical protein
MALYRRGVDAGQGIAPTVFVLAQIASGNINAVARGILGVVVQGATRKGGASDDQSGVEMNPAMHIRGLDVFVAKQCNRCFPSYARAPRHSGCRKKEFFFEKKPKNFCSWRVASEAPG